MGKSNVEQGVIRTIDEQGRVSIPVEIRKLLDIKEGNRLEISTEGSNKVIFTKYSPMNTLKEWGNYILSALTTVIEHDIILTDTEVIINATKKKFVGLTLTNSVQDIIFKREIVVKKLEDGSKIVDVFSSQDCNLACELIVPIIKDNIVLGSIIVLAYENKCFDDDIVKVCKAFSNFLNLVII